jgi:sugar phosphate isomerase/epimerase
MKIAVQLYSIRDGINSGEDMLEALGKVKALGYDGVEFAGYFGLSAETLRARLDELGLKCVGSHLGLDDYKPENLEKTYEFAKTLGTPQIGVGGAAHDTVEECEATGSVLGAAEKVLAERGMNVYYHNHSGEFTPLEDGRTATDIIKGYCHLQIDTYWSFHAGMDNYKLITENKDRIVSIHLKDGVDGTPCALGEGQNNIPEVIRAVKDCGIDWVVVENDDPVPDGISDIGRSIKYLKSII